MPIQTVEMPTGPGYIVRRSGNYRYVYKVLRTYRNEKGQPTNDRKIIGKLNDAGQLIPNENYFSFFDLSQAQPLTQVEYPNSVRSIGASYLVNQLLHRVEVDRILYDVFDDTIAEMVLTIATYMACRGNIFEFIQDWCEEYSFFKLVSPQKSSNLCAMIRHDDIMNFFKAWIDTNNPVDQYVAYDVTSFSTYAKGMKDAEWGYNRNGDKLPQINMGFYLSIQTGLPLFYVTYPGSIVDKSHMPYMMAYNNDLGIHDITYIMDKSFCTTANMQYLHSEKMKYLIAVDKSFKTTREAIGQVRGNITSLGNFIIDNTYGDTAVSRFYGVKSNMHIYFNFDNAEQQRQDLLRSAISIGETLDQLPMLTPKQAKYYSRFYDIKLNEDGTFKHKLSYEKTDFEAQNCGYFCILSNIDANKAEILNLYRKKDLIEKGFDDVKNHIDMKRIHAHTDETTRGKMFCAFIALIATSQMAKTIKDINSVGGKRR
jgi:transposase